VTDYHSAHCPRCLEQLDVPIVIEGIDMRKDPTDWYHGGDLVTVRFAAQEIKHTCPNRQADET
jgi:hypothetical protein